ncbi:MAG: dephospho-CoA kinase [Xanthomonadales bacterium]|nr:dephospho-CoA kinase [Xanthomonadales bacterium]
MRIGLTGGIASGKSVVADMFSARGIPVIDTDLISREVVEPGKAGLRAVIKEFGSPFLNANGTLNRSLLRERIFSDPDSRARLEKILHPLIRTATFAQAQDAGGPYQIIAVPLLTETDFADFVDRILVIDCPEELCRERLLARDAETEDSVARIFSAQASRTERLRIADDVIVNDGSLHDTEHAVEELHQRYLTLSTNA